MSFGDYWGVVRPHLDSALVGDVQWGRILGVASQLPDSGHGGIECRLAACQQQVDLQLNLTPGIPVFPASFMGHPAWRRLMAFCHGWAERGSVLNALVGDIWLEFDLEDAAPPVPLPAIFLAYRAGVTDCGAIATSVGALLPQPLRGDLPSTLRTCLAALPAGASVRHVGWMLSREVGLLRVNVEGLTWDAVPSTLDAVGWPGSRAAYGRLAAMLSGVAGRVVLALDLGGGIRPKLGLECSPGDREADQLRGYTDLIGALVAAGLCAPEKAAAIARWPGVSWRRFHGDVWPSSLRWADRLMGARAESAVCRFINHVKVVVDPDGRTEAKVYLAYRHTWVDHGRFSE